MVSVLFSVVWGMCFAVNRVDLTRATRALFALRLFEFLPMDLSLPFALMLLFCLWHAMWRAGPLSTLLVHSFYNNHRPVHAIMVII